MSSKCEDGIYTPLPPKLPPKGKQREDDPSDHINGKKSPRLRRVKVIHRDPDDEDAYPQVESPPPRPKRDSGKYYVVEPAGSSGVRREYERRRPDPEVQRLVDDLERERRERREAERAAVAAQEAAERLRADLAREKHQRTLDRRECALRDSQKRLGQEQPRLVEVRRPHDRHEVVVVHNPPPTLPIVEASSALNRAQADYRRSHPEHDLVRGDQRPGTAERRPRRQSVIIVERDRSRDRDRGWRRR
ncbi:hypothetical protein A1O1_05339 [Capronia coronata CBS 617.96]|uniref:Uncharacterized protein n=1 Tax=Capronia coronata CBS 617.96 TaxID=1182541 RepID=W9Z1M8_9EURO|nr:uncharacterized protein A1O1_05339 [Capronia coronata CBS 617.96]EXJ88409.1 hypothetical protein A1O1_05339 [Capronia coronata CBS 617.96]